MSRGIELCNVRYEGNDELTIYITVFVPNNQRNYFFNKIEQYLEEDTKKGNPKNKALIEGIEDIRKTIVESFWIDDKELIPSEYTKEWCEVWIRKYTDAEEKFTQILEKMEIKCKKDSLSFPERIIKLIYVSRQDLNDLIRYSDAITEYRKAKITNDLPSETADFLLTLSPAEQSEWVDDFVSQRLSIENESNISICLLDTGVNNGHPLIAPLLSDNDRQAVVLDWGVDDHGNHGTRMSGLLGYGDLQKHLESKDSVIIKHCIESVKILPPDDDNDEELWGYITQQAINKAEIENANRKRIVCMAVSGTYKGYKTPFGSELNKGYPTSWSATIDQITSGANDDERKLMIVAAGNSADYDNDAIYPDLNLKNLVHDPGQSWNALTVGATTNLQNITDLTLSSYEPMAKDGELSPFTTTSMNWDNKWPNKPDVVFEGGNLAVIKNNGFVDIVECNDLSLISTHYKPLVSSLSHFTATSAATAQAANFAACLQAEYPDYWPETIRALMVHSARWSDGVKSQIINKDGKKELRKILRSCGYGQPNLEQALYCAQNSLTLIAEQKIQPFEKIGNEPKTKDMHLYELPWPKKILEDLGEVIVEMQITLSYFIEPSPGGVGWKDQYTYASHGLRFDLNAPEEDKANFRKRINSIVREEANKVYDRYSTQTTG